MGVVVVSYKLEFLSLGSPEFSFSPEVKVPFHFAPVSLFPIEVALSFLCKMARRNIGLLSSTKRTLKRMLKGDHKYLGRKD